MRQHLKIPRIIRIEAVKELTVHCMFNNGETRVLHFDRIFKEWKVTENDPEYPLLQPRNFKKVELRNFTLSWPNITVTIPDENGKEQIHPYEIGPDVLYRLSEPVPDPQGGFGKLIRKARLSAGLTQEQLAERSGTTRFYISRIESGRTDVELATLRKIVKAGLGKNLNLVIE